MMFLRAKGRGAYIFGTFEIRLCQIGIIQSQVMGAGFAGNSLTSFLSPYNFIQCFLTGYMNDINRSVCNFCQVNRSGGSFSFYHRRTGKYVGIRFRFPFGDKLLLQYVNGICIFCMDHNGNSAVPGFDERL